MNTASTLGSGPLPSNTIANPKGELKAITIRSGLVLDVPSVPMPPPFINSEEDEHAKETLTDPELVEYTIKMLKSLLYNKEKVLELANTPLNENFSAIILKKLPEKLRDPRKFLIPCGFSELKCKALANLGASINLMPLLLESSHSPLILSSLIMRAIPLILGRPFLWTARALIDIHEEEMILCGGDERLTLNMRHDTSSYSNQPHKESINMINIYNDSYEDYLEYLFATNHLSGNPTFSSQTDLTLPKVINPLSGNTTSSSLDHLLEEFADEFVLITFPPGNDDLLFYIEFDLREIEYLLNHDPTKEIDSIHEDLVDEGNLTDPNNDLVDTILEMFIDEHTLDYSSPPLYDDVDNDLVELESDNDDVYDDPFDSEEDKIKESKLLIDELDPPRSSYFLPSPECKSILYEDFSEVDAFPSTNNYDKVINPGILIHENLFEVTIRVTTDKNVKKISISNASLILEEYLENPSNEIATLNSNQEKEKPPKDSDIRQLIREECCIEVCEEQRQNMENTILELINFNYQRLDKKKQEVKNVVEQPTERETRIIESLQNFRVIHKRSTSLNNMSQISLVHAIAPIISTKEPEYSLSMGYEHPNTTPKMVSDEIIKSGVEELVPILRENEVTLEDKKECDVPVCENSPICDDHFEIFSDSNNDDDILSDDDAFEDIEYVEASLPNPETVSVEEENGVEEEEVDLEDIFQIQDIILREKLLSINQSDNSLSDNFSPEFETFCDHTEETRNGSTTTHADDSLPEYDSFCFEIEPDQGRLINVVKNDISDDSTNDPLLEEVDLFLSFDNLIPPVSCPPPEPPDAEFDFETDA
uniref:Reverse transcriptase domain-containing protein n=1 Tax=Tanacetum cinerariifolium TaxID=118510 RepID=A0A6L2MJR4_TANCI|nr:hypothetical protein [Tanacetum cinerariifolium]